MLARESISECSRISKTVFELTNSANKMLDELLKEKFANQPEEKIPTRELLSISEYIKERTGGKISINLDEKKRVEDDCWLEGLSKKPSVKKTMERLLKKRFYTHLTFLNSTEFLDRIKRIYKIKQDALALNSSKIYREADIVLPDELCQVKYF